MFNFLQELRTYVTSLDSELHVLVYYVKKDHMITEQTANSSAFLYTRYSEAGSEHSYDEWMEGVSTRYTNQYRISSDFSVDFAELHLVYCHTVMGYSQIRRNSCAPSTCAPVSGEGKTTINLRMSRSISREMMEAAISCSWLFPSTRTAYNFQMRCLQRSNIDTLPCPMWI